ncbi:MAG: hypothetical protein M3490_07790, partial [Chloroflexota bacterium]|nr:hypothetical protein [Chloroflexota bacterium]
MTTTQTAFGLTPERLVIDLRAASQPAISPDGTRIVYSLSSVDLETMKSTSQLWAMDIDGGNQVQLTFNGRTNANPVWSPDGASLAFTSRREGDQPYAICILPITGGESREVTCHAVSPSSLGWSPDGSS